MTFVRYWYIAQLHSQTYKKVHYMNKKGYYIDYSATCNIRTPF